MGKNSDHDGPGGRGWAALQAVFGLMQPVGCGLDMPELNVVSFCQEGHW